MGRIYDVHCLNGLRWHDIYTKFHYDSFKLSSNIVITSTVSEAAVLVLMMGVIYGVRLEISSRAKILILWRICSFARQRLGKHCLKAGIVEPDTELSICQAAVHARFRNNAFMKSSSGTLGGGDLCSVLPQLEKGVNSCRGGVEYLHRDPASRRRRRKEKSRIWDSKIWSWVSRD
jgi:hypothetical protein